MSAQKHPDLGGDETGGPEPSNNLVKDEELKHAVNETFPEGGIQAWATVLGAFFVQFWAIGYASSYGVFQDYYVRVYLTNESASTISWIGSINAFLTTIVSLPVGRIYDRGHFSALLYGGCILVSFSLFMLSLAKPGQYYQILLSQGFGAGIGIGMIYIPSIAIPSQYFYRRRTLVMVFVNSGAFLGVMIHSIMLNNLLEKIGFANATRANAGLVSGMLFLSCFLMRTRLSNSAAAPSNSTGVQNVKQGLVKFSKDKAFVCYSFSLLFFTFGSLFPLFYIQLDAIRHGLSPNFAFYTLVIMNGATLLGGLMAGFLATGLGVRVEVLMIISSACYGALICANLRIPMASVTTVVVISVFYGISGGIFLASVPPMAANLADDVSEIGLRMSVAFTLSGFAELFGGPIDGVLLTANNHWWRPAVFSGIVILIASGLLVLMMLFMRKRNEVTARIDDVIKERV